MVTEKFKNVIVLKQDKVCGVYMNPSHVFVSVSLDSVRYEGLTHPVPHIKEALLVREVKEQQEAHGIPEERCGQTPESA